MDEAIVVGVDGTDNAARAAEWAARQAIAWELPLRLVHAMSRPVYERAQLHQPVPITGEESMRRWVVDMLAELAERCRAQGAVDVHIDLVSGDPTDVVLRSAEHSVFAVVGHSDSEGVTRALPGPTVAHLIESCPVPVVVVRRPPRDPDGPVVIGVDGSPISGRALRFGYEFAARVGAEVLAVHATSGAAVTAAHPVESNAEEALRYHGGLVGTELADCARRHPQVTSEFDVIVDAPVDALLAAADNARLLVVGSHGKGLVRRALLGSVSHAVVDLAPCPVAVLPPHAAVA
ncbi:universal stress protein [Saccharothrix deserti]|uniref:universal stress protein n=1 Tax=Saccharothrix deserti TaxID=2593674 RepID=UPI00131EB120|nr:universal stress protein [Saccharothrix deserti]